MCSKKIDAKTSVNATDQIPEPIYKYNIPIRDYMPYEILWIQVIEVTSRF